MLIGDKHSKQSIAIALMAVLCCLVGCGKVQKKNAHIDAVLDRRELPVLAVDTVTTLISDSGIVRYRISAVKWEIFDKADPPYWEFKQGIYLERFNEALETESSLESDYAHYNEKEQIWELDGNVRAMNLKGEHFETEQLFWNQKTERVYSDSAITITRAETVIKGVGFDSNQTLTEYIIRRPTGIFPINDDN